MPSEAAVKSLQIPTILQLEQMLVDKQKEVNRVMLRINREEDKLHGISREAGRQTHILENYQIVSQAYTGRTQERLRLGEEASLSKQNMMEEYINHSAGKKKSATAVLSVIRVEESVPEADKSLEDPVMKTPAKTPTLAHPPKKGALPQIVLVDADNNEYILSKSSDPLRQVLKKLMFTSSSTFFTTPQCSTSPYIVVVLLAD
jgi:hypothetical protein